MGYTRGVLWLYLVLGCVTPSLADGPGELVCKLKNPAVKESSGLALGATGEWWTHNDSLGTATLFGFDGQCGGFRKVKLEGAQARDWEELAAFDQEGERWLLVGDTGDNQRKRDQLTLYLLPEPAPGVDKVVFARRIDFRFPDEPHDTEAIAVDPPSDTILLITKDRGEETRVYQLPLSEREGVQIATEVSRIALGPEGDKSARRVIAMDLSPDRKKLALLTYTSAWVYEHTPNGSWAETFARTPKAVPIPPLQQGEALAWDAEGKHLYLTSEGVPMPLVRVTP